MNDKTQAFSPLRKRILCTISLATIFGLLLSACTAEPTPNSPQGQSSKPKIVVSHYPYQYLVERLVKDKADVINLTPPGVEPHDLELTPQNIQDIASADLVVYQRGFQPALDEAIETNEPRGVIDASASKFGAISVTHVAIYDSGVSEEVTVPISSETAPLENVKSYTDPHSWLYPPNLALLTEAIYGALYPNPALKQTLEGNKESLTRDLETLDSIYQQTLSKEALVSGKEKVSNPVRTVSSCEVQDIVTTHNAFSYWNVYSIDEHGISGTDPTVEPTAADIAAIQDIIKEFGITTIFQEPLTTNDAATSIANDLQLKTAVLDPLESTPPEGQDYYSVMMANLEALKLANGCK